MNPSARIMIVEDEAVVALDLEGTLKDLGYEVLGIASTGLDAVEKAEELRPDIILMDIVLIGDMDGIETAKVVRERFNIPVIYLTAYSSEDILEKAKITGPYSYLIKPFSREELNSAIKIGLYKHKMDIEIIKSHEELEIAYNELRSIDGMKQNIIDRVSSEMKTPLSISMEALGFAMDENEKKVVDKYLKMIREALNRQLRIVEDLVVESWSYREKLDLKRDNIFLKDLVQLVIGEMRDEIEKREITIKTNLSDIQIHADFNSMKHALFNIVDNAVKFSRKGEKQISISAWRKRGKVEVIIEDNGIGIPKEFHERIFDKLFQIDQDTTGKYPGTGMGLSAAKTIIESHGGKIWVESGPDKGSMFHFTIPNYVKEG